MAGIQDLVTPACLIDEPRLRRNAKRLSDLCAASDLPLRPHIKTLKSVQAAHIYAPQPCGITVSTLAEARYFAAAGYDDILYAVGITANKVAAISELLAAGVRLTVVVDSEQGAQALLGMASDFVRPLQVAIEVDVDDHRAGIAPQDPALITIAQQLGGHPNLSFHGLMAHAGASYGCFDPASQRAMAKQEASQIVLAAEHLQQQGIECTMVSVGSTPTAFAEISRPGVTELRAGVYATFDCVMAGLNVCTLDDIAISVATSVIGHQLSKGWVLIDAGWMALSRDQGTASHPRDCGYGLVCDAQGQLLDGWFVSQTNQEHGIVCHVDGITPPSDLFAFGSVLRILPVHACATASQFEQYQVTKDNRSICAVWNRVNGW